MPIRRLVRRSLRAAKRWLDQPETADETSSVKPVEFDNSYDWLRYAFGKVMRDPSCSSRPQYVWGMLQGAALARVLGIREMCALEFGVASGAGLLAMERIAEHCEILTGPGTSMAIFGFDTGTGFPKPQDYRDLPYRWSEGFYPCDKEVLAGRLQRAQVHYGLVGETLLSFVRGNPPPVAFVGVDVCFYSSALQALRLFDAEDRLLLPRMPCSFRGSIGKEFCEYIGEPLAISEFNSRHEDRKLCQTRGLRYFVPSEFDGHWTEMLHTFHAFRHPAYGVAHSYAQSAIIDIDGRETFVRSDSSIDRPVVTAVHERSQ